MSVRQFTLQLLLVTLFVGVVLGLLSFLPVFARHQQLSWLSLILFIVISIIMYFTGRWGVNSENKTTFIGLMYAYMGGKMFLSIVLIMMYYYYIEPKSKLFILPFFVVYLIFTIFESYFLMKLNENSKN